jgi:replicative superfamily II helicase
MTVKDTRQQVIIRLYPDIYGKVKAKVIQDKLSIQKLAEILFDAYLKNNKEVCRLVEKYADQKHAKRRRFSLNEEEADEFMRRIEMENISPLTQFNEMFDDVILDDDDDED